jgi:hypothetical protein
MLTIREWMIDNLLKYRSTKEAIRACSKNLGYSIESVRDKTTKCIKKGLLEPKDSYNPSLKDSSSLVGLSVNDMREKYDALYKIEKAVKEIPAGRFVPEAEFRECVVKCEASKFRAKAELEQFNKYKGVAKGTTYWANPVDIKRLKDQGVLQ